MDARTPNDRAPCTLHIAAQGDALYKMRRLLLGQMKFLDDEAFEVAALSPHFVPVFPADMAGDADASANADAVQLDELEESSAMAFARVAVMTKEEASARLHDPEVHIVWHAFHLARPTAHNLISLLPDSVFSCLVSGHATRLLPCNSSFLRSNSPSSKAAQLALCSQRLWRANWRRTRLPQWRCDTDAQSSPLFAPWQIRFGARSN